MSKIFTVSEAQNLLPILQSLMQQAQRSGMRAAELELAMEELNRRIFLSGGMYIDVAAAARRRAEREKAVEETSSTIAEIEAIGARLHDLPEGLLDLPCRLEDETVCSAGRLARQRLLTGTRRAKSPDLGSTWTGASAGVIGSASTNSRIP